MSLGREKGYDEDARQLTSQEVLQDVEGASEEEKRNDGAPLLELRSFRSMSPITSENIRGLVYLKPLVQR